MTLNAYENVRLNGLNRKGFGVISVGKLIQGWRCRSTQAV